MMAAAMLLFTILRIFLSPGYPYEDMLLYSRYLGTLNLILNNVELSEETKNFCFPWMQQAIGCALKMQGDFNISTMNKEVGAGSPQACASCKHQRKRCDEACELAPYFPAHRYYEYQNAHKLYGLNNILKILSSVEPHQRQAAAESILQEGNARCNDPVHGCLGIVRNLRSQIEFYEKELGTVNQQLAFFRDKEQMQQQKQQCENSSSVVLPPFSSSSLQHEFDGVNYQIPTFPDLPNIDDMKIFDHGYNYQSTLEEGADVKPFDIQPIHQILDPYQNGQALTCFNGSGDSSVAPNTNGKMLLDCPDDEEAQNEG